MRAIASAFPSAGAPRIREQIEAWAASAAAYDGFAPRCLRRILRPGWDPAAWDLPELVTAANWAAEAVHWTGEAGEAGIEAPIVSTPPTPQWIGCSDGCLDYGAGRSLLMLTLRDERGATLSDHSPLAAAVSVEVALVVSDDDVPTDGDWRREWKQRLAPLAQEFGRLEPDVGSDATHAAEALQDSQRVRFHYVPLPPTARPV